MTREAYLVSFSFAFFLPCLLPLPLQAIHVKDTLESGFKKQPVVNICPSSSTYSHFIRHKTCVQKPPGVIICPVRKANSYTI